MTSTDQALPTVVCADHWQTSYMLLWPCHRLWEDAVGVPAESCKGIRAAQVESTDACVLHQSKLGANHCPASLPIGLQSHHTAQVLMKVAVLGLALNASVLCAFSQSYCHNHFEKPWSTLPTAGKI